MGMMYFDEAKIDILKELSINIAKLHDIYGLVVKDEFLINASYLQKVTDSIDQLGAINEKMQRLYSRLSNGEKYREWDYEELKRRNQDIIDEVYNSKWGYNPYEE